MLANVIGMIALGFILLGLLTRSGLLIPLPLLSGVASAGLAYQLGSGPVVVTLDAVAVVLGAGAYLWALRLRTRRQRPDPMPVTRRVIASITGVGDNPQSVALSPDGRSAYVGANDSGTLAVVDLDIREVRALVPVGRGAADLLVLPGGERVLVAIVKLLGGRLVIVDPAAGQVTGTVAEVRQPRGMAASPDGRSVYVTSMADHKLWRLDARTLEVTGSATVGKRPVSVAASPDGAKLYVANFWSDSVSVLDAATLETTATFPTRGPGNLALDGRGERLYVTGVDGTLGTFDTATGQPAGAPAKGDSEGGLAVANGFCYVADPWAGMVRVYEADRLYWRDELVLGGRAPIALAVGPDGLLYVAGQAGRLDVVRPEQPSGG
ncbi:MAG: hypothetical protein AUG44_25830 [Actinobacteria bacterium 13_1_20CM_3_71_11]|nr:MAG: hypothetical protein AUG44_25830 [Actinobacteria bacterium 13_1_20CM_3_71_11]